MKMPYYSKEDILKVKEIDLLSYLEKYEPDELVHISRNTYCTKTHDSLKISNGMWYWFSRGIGGKTALEYLIKVRELSFIQAMEFLSNKTVDYTPLIKKESSKKNLILPPKSDDIEKVKIYLMSRGISEDIIQECIDNEFIYQEKYTGNVVFVGYDEQQNPKYAGLRGTNTSRFMKEASGSDKAYSFRLVAKEKTNTIHLFESAIDLLSYATLLEIENKNYYQETLIAMAGVYQPSSNLIDSKVPISLLNYLKNNPNIDTIIIHFDNDLAGQMATNALKIKLENFYNVVSLPAKIGKDFNDYLCITKGIYHSKINKKQERF